MIKELSVAGLGEVENLEELIRLAAQNGFETVDTNGSDLRAMINEKGYEGTSTFLNENNISIGSFGLPVQWRTTDEEFQRDLAQLIEDVNTFSEFGCTICYTYVLPSTDEEIFPWMVKATKRLKLCAQILNEYGIGLGLEFVGPHHLRKKWKNPFIWSISDTLKWIDLIDEDNVGLLLDSFHWYTIGGTVDDILALNPSQITHVHINDAKDVPVEEVLDDDRLYPGEGVIDLVGFMKALKEIHYTGVVAQEVLTPTSPTESSEELARKSGEAFRHLFAKAEI